MWSELFHNVHQIIIKLTTSDELLKVPAEKLSIQTVYSLHITKHLKKITKKYN